MHSAINVLHVMGPLKPSGMERMLISAKPYWDGLGLKGSIIGIEHGSTFASELEAAGYNVYLTEEHASSRKTFSALKKVILEDKINVVHIHTEASYFKTVLNLQLALMLAYRSINKYAIVRTIHSNFMAKGKWKISRSVQAFLTRPFVYKSIACSPDVKKNEFSIGRKTDVILNWVDDRYFKLAETRKNEYQPNEPYIALLVGNCAAVKNHEFALKRVYETGGSLIHIGDEAGASSEEKALLEKFAEEGRIVDRGAKPPDSGLLASDVFLLPSLYEGFSLALAEALITGVPSVVSLTDGLGWAKKFNNVKFEKISDEVAWHNALRAVFNENTPSDLGIQKYDLSPQRGANEYFQLYNFALHNLNG